MKPKVTHPSPFIPPTFLGRTDSFPTPLSGELRVNIASPCLVALHLSHHTVYSQEQACCLLVFHPESPSRQPTGVSCLG